MCLHQLLIARIGIYSDLFAELFSNFTICEQCKCKVAADCIICGEKLPEFRRGFRGLVGHLINHTGSGIDIFNIDFEYRSPAGNIKITNFIELYPQILLIKLSCKWEDNKSFEISEKKIIDKCKYKLTNNVRKGCRCGHKIIEHMITYRASCFICNMEFDCFPSVEMVVNHLSNCSVLHSGAISEMRNIQSPVGK